MAITLDLIGDSSIQKPNDFPSLHDSNAEIIEAGVNDLDDRMIYVEGYLHNVEISAYASILNIVYAADALLQTQITSLSGDVQEFTSNVYGLSAIVEELQTTYQNHWAASGTNIYKTNDGNVGIGTAVPESDLHIKAPLATIRLEGNHAGSDDWVSYIQSNNTASAADVDIGRIISYRDTDDDSGGYIIQTTNNQIITEALRINKDGHLKLINTLTLGIVAGSEDNGTVKYTPNDYYGKSESIWKKFIRDDGNDNVVILGNLSVAENLTISGSSTFLGAITAQNEVTFSDGITANAEAVFAGSVTTNGALIANGTITANNEVTFNDGITANAEAVFNGLITAEGGVTFNGNITADGEAEFNSAVTFNDEVTFTDNVVISGGFSVDCNINMNFFQLTNLGTGVTSDNAVTVSQLTGHTAATGTAVHGLGNASVLSTGGATSNVPVIANPGFTGAWVNSPAVLTSTGTLAAADAANSVIITDADKNATTQAIATGFNKAIGTTSGTVADGGTMMTLFNNSKADGATGSITNNTSAAIEISLPGMCTAIGSGGSGVFLMIIMGNIADTAAIWMFDATIVSARGSDTIVMQCKATSEASGNTTVASGQQETASARTNETITYLPVGALNGLSVTIGYNKKPGTTDTAVITLTSVEGIDMDSASLHAIGILLP